MSDFEFKINSFPAVDRNFIEKRSQESSRESKDIAESFANFLETSIEKVNQNQVQADQAIKEFVAGKNKNIHETLLTVEKADMSMKLMLQVRNKILDAYREIMRMQV